MACLEAATGCPKRRESFAPSSLLGRAPRPITGDCEHARTGPALITVTDHTITGPITGRRRGPPARPWPSHAPTAGRCPGFGPRSASRRGSPRVARPSERVLQRRADGWRAPPLVQAAIGQRRGTKECRHWLQSLSSSSNSWSRPCSLSSQSASRRSATRGLAYAERGNSRETVRVTSSRKHCSRRDA